MVVDFVIYLLGEDVINSGDIKCKLETYIIVVKEIGGIYMMF
jgi:hypothetical protein